MNFNELIRKMMPEVNGGTDESIMIYRKNGEWHGDFTQNQYGEPFDWVDDIKEQDPLAITVKGSNFAKGSFPYVYDKVLIARLRAEYDFMDRSGMILTDADRNELNALVNFFEDNAGEFSHKAMDYLTTLERPFMALYEMCPFEIATDVEDWTYNEKSAQEAIDHIENEVSDRLHSYPDEDTPKKHHIEGYEERASFQLAGRLVILAEKTDAGEPYMVCNCRWDNPLSIYEYYDVQVTSDYLNAVTLFLNYQNALLEQLKTERQQSGLPFQTLTAANCLPNSARDNFEGKLIVIKPEALTPEYRSAEHQLKYCTGGFGANPDSRGSAVFCKDLYSGKESRFERWDVAGIADMQTLPAWVDKKIALDKATKEPGVFEYGGVHFKPYRDFRKGEVIKRLEGDSRPWKYDVQYEMRHMSSDTELGFTRNTAWSKMEFSGTDFVTAAGENTADIYQCIENGRLYVPYLNELFQYKEPPQRTKSQKPSLADRIEKGKKKVRESDQNKEKPDKPKKHDKGVDD
jgi:hypothetical protein